MMSKSCIGCGFCCRKTPCDVARRAGKVDNRGKCQLLRWDGERYRCGIMVDEFYDYVRAKYIQDLSIGAGCCAGLNTDRERIPSPAECELVVPEERDIPWKRIVQVFARSLMSGMASGDQVFIMASDIERELGRDVADVFVAACKDSQTSFMKGFMG